MRILLFFVLALCSCKSYFPPEDYCVKGTYVGKDSVLIESDIYGAKLFGNCIKVEKLENGVHSFFDQQLVSINKNTFKFDYTIATDYGIGNCEDLHNIRRVGTFNFSGNKLVIEYSVGEVGQTMSQYRFEGWR